MKKFLLLLLVAIPAFAATTFTTNYNLGKPGDGDSNFGQIVRDNLDTIDTVMKANETANTDHINDTTGAHAATAISATSGTFSCTSQTTVQAYLDCLDGVLDPATSGFVTLTGAQTITGIKTFSAAPVFSSLPTTAILSTNGSGTVTASTFNSVDPLTTKGDIAVHDGTDSTRLAVGTDGQVLVADSAQAEGVDWVNQNPRWRKFTLAFGDFSAAATTFGSTIFQLAAGEGIDTIVVHHTAAFSGGTITAYTVEVGVSGNTDTFADTFDVFQASAGTTRQITNTVDVPNLTSTTDVVVTATSTGANLDQALAGSVDVYVRTFLLP